MVKIEGINSIFQQNSFSPANPTVGEAEIIFVFG